MGVPSRLVRLLRMVVAVAPPALLGLVGLFHPVSVGVDPARWAVLHVVALPLFPLLGIAPWLLLRDRAPRLAVVAAVLGYVFATGYTALDVLAGIGAGALRLEAMTGQEVLFAWARALALPAVLAYLAATVLAAGVLLRAAPARAAPGAVLVVLGAVSFLNSHIAPWRGVATMAVLAVGWGLLAAAAARGERVASRSYTGASAGAAASDPGRATA